MSVAGNKLGKPLPPGDLGDCCAWKLLLRRTGLPERTSSPATGASITPCPGAGLPAPVVETVIKRGYRLSP